MNQVGGIIHCMETGIKKYTCIHHLLVGAPGLRVSTHFIGLLFHSNLGTLQTVEAHSK